MLIGKKEEFRMKELLSEAVMVLCKATLTYRTQLNVQGLIGITIDDQEIFLVNINESLHKGNNDNSGTDTHKSKLSSSKDDCSASSSDEESSSHKTTRKRSTSPESSSHQSIKTKQLKHDNGSDTQESDLEYEKKPPPIIQSKPTPIMVKKEKPVKVAREENGPSRSLLPQVQFRNHVDIHGNEVYMSDDSEDSSISSTLGFTKLTEGSRDSAEASLTASPGGASALDAVVKRLREQSKTATTSSDVIPEMSPAKAAVALPTTSQWPNKFLPASQLLGSMNALYTEQKTERSLTPEDNSNVSDSDLSSGQGLLPIAMVPNKSHFDQTSPVTSNCSVYNQKPVIHVPNLLQATAPIDKNRHPKAWAGGCQCKLCGKRFPSPSALEKHLRIHTGEKPFTCPACGRGFSQEGNMRRHHMRHAAEQHKKLEFKCYLCEVDFPDSDILLHHLSLVHDIQQPSYEFNQSIATAAGQAITKPADAFTSSSQAAEGFESANSKSLDGFGLATPIASESLSTAASKPTIGMTLGPHLIIQEDDSGKNPEASTTSSQVNQGSSDAN